MFILKIQRFKGHLAGLMTAPQTLPHNKADKIYYYLQYNVDFLTDVYIILIINALIFSTKSISVFEQISFMELFF